MSTNIDRLAANGAPYHGYIISGADEAAANAAAEKLAASALCQGSGRKPCGTCRDCRKAAESCHPDIIYVEKPADKKEIPVAAVRELTASISVLPNEAARKVYIIKNADTMNRAAQNALLKAIEEPPHFVVIILVCENAGRLLPTVRSRCVELSVLDEREETADEYREEAERLLALLFTEQRSELADFAFELEKKKTDVTALSRSVREAVLRKIRTGSAVGKERAELLKTAELFSELEKYAFYNVSVGHIFGLMLARLA